MTLLILLITSKIIKHQVYGHAYDILVLQEKNYKKY